MHVTVPSFYKKFKCTADKCTDSCCIGWEIDIDPETYEYYKSVGGEFGKRLRRDIETDGDVHFRLNGERCAFLNNKNLCDIYINCGEEHLCEICTEHPRFHEWFGNYKESGLGLCCEEACRLLFENDLSLHFETIETDEAPDDREFDKNLFYLLTEAESEILRDLMNRFVPLKFRLKAVIYYAELIQDYIDFGIKPDIIRDDLFKHAKSETYNHEDYYKNLIGILKELEPISPDFPEFLKDLENRLPEILNSFDYFCNYFENRSYEYESLAAYTVYRYFMKATFDGEVISKVKFAETFTAAVFLFDCCTLLTTGKFTMTDRINNVKMFSKEVEYCEENLEIMMH